MPGVEDSAHDYRSFHLGTHFDPKRIKTSLQLFTVSIKKKTENINSPLGNVNAHLLV